MIRAYNGLYLNDAMETLAETFGYVCGPKEIDYLFDLFVVRGIARQFERGNPRYLNMPSHALFYEIMGYRPKPNWACGLGRTPEYWCGHVLAYYQWYTGLKFEQIGRRLMPSQILRMYHPLHEASLDKFVDVANGIVFGGETNLARLRKCANISQRELSLRSGVSEHSIQLYEQRKRNINVAAATTLYRLSRALNCNMEDLLELDEL